MLLGLRVLWSVVSHGRRHTLFALTFHQGTQPNIAALVVRQDMERALLQKL